MTKCDTKEEKFHFFWKKIAIWMYDRI